MDSVQMQFCHMIFIFFIYAYDFKEEIYVK